MKKKTIFFDHTSTTPPDPQVAEAMAPFLGEEFGNPSSHMSGPGRNALAALDEARSHVAKMINADTCEIVFTSGATESNNLAVKGLAFPRIKQGGHILISQIEHYSVMDAAKRLKKYGFEVEEVPVDKHGVIDLDRLKEMIKPETFLVCIMLSNTEIGTIEPVKKAVEAVKSKAPSIHFHCDAASSAGWIPVDVKDLGVDTLTVSAHNFYGPKGVGALYVKTGVKLEPLFDGGFQEQGVRSGTENVIGIVGMGKAAQLATKNMDSRVKHLEKLQKRLWNGLEKVIQYAHFTGHPKKRLPGHVSLWIEFAEGESLLLMLQVKGIIAASGSACSSNMLAEDEDELIHSHVLAAVGVPQDICSGSLTFLLGKDSTEEEVDTLIKEFPDIVKKLWAMSPAYSDMLSGG